MLKNSKQKGSVLVISLLILSAILVGAISISMVAVRERKTSLGSNKSNQAFQRADQGVEEVLQDIRNISATPGASVRDLVLNSLFCDTASGIIKKGSDYEVSLLDASNNLINCDSTALLCSVYNIKSVGISSAFKRAVQASITPSGNCECPATVDDADGNTYATTRVGTQCWMAENLNVGGVIPGALNPSLPTIEKYCYDDQVSNCSTYGGLYQWAEAMNGDGEGGQGICPTNWHIPTDAELYELENFLRDPAETCDSTRNNNWDCDNAGEKMKSGGVSNLEVLEDAGIRNDSGSFNPSRTYIWSSTGSGGSDAFMRELRAASTDVNREDIDRENGASIRCIKN